MIAYMESNFVLELAFLREEHESCINLISLAESKGITLVLPAFSVGEPYEAWVRRAKQRKELANKLTTEIGELSRSKPYQAASQELHQLTALLVRSSDEEKRRLDDALDRILNTTEIIPIGLTTIRSAITFQNSRGLSPQDSIVYASILQHLATAPSGPRCFITKNSRDFSNPDIVSELAAYNCRLLTRFSNALGYIQNHQS